MGVEESSLEIAEVFCSPFRGGYPVFDVSCVCRSGALERLLVRR